jgi:hypothetical protein
MWPTPAFLFLFTANFSVAQQKKPRARDLDIPFDSKSVSFSDVANQEGN